MPVSPAFIAQVSELLEPLGAIAVRPMFGAAGVYCDGQILALLADDVLYFKVDDTTRPAFAAEDCGPFIYTTKTGDHEIAAYHRAPERLFDEPDAMLAFARTALAVGHRAAQAKPKSARKTPRQPVSR